MTPVRAFHNVTEDSAGAPVGMLAGYKNDHVVALVFVAEMRAQPDDVAICEEVYRLLNVGDDPGFGTPDPGAVAYRSRGNRSLSVGDVVQVDEIFYACQRFGWCRIEPPTVAHITTAGTTPLPPITYRYLMSEDRGVTFRQVSAGLDEQDRGAQIRTIVNENQGLHLKVTPGRDRFQIEDQGGPCDGTVWVFEKEN